MADGESHAAAPAHGEAAPGDGVAQPGHKTPSLENIVPLEQVESFMRSKANTPNPFSRQHTSLDLDDYFVSPPLSAAAVDAMPNWHAATGARMAPAPSPPPFFLIHMLSNCSMSIANGPVDGPSRHQQTFKMAAVSTDARQYSTKDDSAALLPGRLGDMHNMHLGTYPGKV